MKNNNLIPQCWEEMTQRQFEYLLKKVFVMMANELITQQDVLRDFADFLCGRKRYFIQRKINDYLFLVNGVANILAWIFAPSPQGEGEGGEVLFDFNSVQNLIPKIGRLVGPKSAGWDLKFGEYRKACWMYNNYTVNHDTESLNGLVGILYRKSARDVKKSTFKGDYREEFNEYRIGDYAGRVKHVPEHIKWGVYCWFSYFCKYLMSESFMIDGNEVSFAPLFQAGDPETKKDDSLGMMSVLFSLAESRTFGTITETDNAPLFKVMMKLLSDYQTAQNLKKQ